MIVIMNGAAFVLAVGVPIFAYIVSIAASLFASWYTYGIAGAFWLYDAYHDEGGWDAYKKHKIKFVVNVATFWAGAFICVAGKFGCGMEFVGNGRLMIVQAHMSVSSSLSMRTIVERWEVHSAAKPIVMKDRRTGDLETRVPCGGPRTQICRNTGIIITD